METFEEMEIQRYMYLNQEIARLEWKKLVKRSEFYQQTFSSHVVYNGYEVLSHSIRVETAVEYLDMICRTLDRRIEITQLKANYWKMFFNSLTSMEQSYFVLKYTKGHHRMNDRLDNLAIAEIEEIQEAITFRFDIKDEDTYKIELIPNDFLSNIDLILSKIGGD